MRPTTSIPKANYIPLLISLLILSTPYLLWHTLCHLSHTHSPLVIVTSESMLPIYQRGDILFVSNRTAEIALGDVVVCWFAGRELPFVHRVVEKRVLDDVRVEAPEGEGMGNESR